MPTFHDPRLQEALEIAKPHIEGFPSNLDRISEDIKTFEEYLNDHVSEVIEFELSSGDCEYSEDAPGLYHVERETEHLVYGRSGKRWRVFYKKVQWEGEDGDDSSFSLEWKVAHFRESRPLIETKAQVRIRASKVLPDFLKKVARHFAIEPSVLDEKPELDPSEIPF